MAGCTRADRQEVDCDLLGSGRLDRQDGTQAPGSCSAAGLCKHILPKDPQLGSPKAWPVAIERFDKAPARFVSSTTWTKRASMYLALGRRRRRCGQPKRSKFVEVPGSGFCCRSAKRRLQIPDRQTQAPFASRFSANHRTSMADQECAERDPKNQRIFCLEVSA